MKTMNTRFFHLVKTSLCLFGLLVPCANLMADGQETYRPMLKDGRVWNCIEVYLGEEQNDTVACEYRIEQTSEIDGHVCYNLCLGNKQFGTYYEEGPKVFHYTASGWELLFDFSLSPGDVVPNTGGIMVDEVKTIVMKGVSRRCVCFPLTTVDGTQLCWIEGIGSSVSGPYSPNMVSGSLLSEKLMSVYDGDVCVFEADDLLSNTDVEINETNFPDENFRNWVLTQSYGIDGVLTDAEIKSITSLALSNNGIKSLKGIEYFTDITRLHCATNQLTELDVSKNTELAWLDCSGNQLTKLDVTKNTALEELQCYYNKLTALDVSENIFLGKLYCYHNNLTALDVSKNTMLKDLRCYKNMLSSLDVSENIILTHLECYDNQLTALDLSKNTALIYLWCFDNQLTALDVTECPKMTDLRCYNNRLALLVVSKNPTMRTIQCYQNQIKGAAMDALVESLPTTSISNRAIWVIFDENEQNVMTKAQAAASKAKGWIPCASHRVLEQGTTRHWLEYTGSEPTEVLSFTTGQMATIILPSAPDASKGKYYRLDRWENGKIVFEEEAEPKARTPYIIVPNEDFSIDLSTVDLEGLSRDTVSIEGVSFIGSYCSGELGCEESGYIDIIDTTPDCQAADGENMRKALVGSLRACLVVNWDEPYSQGGSKGVTEKAEITLQDNPNGIAGIQNKKVRSIYDLQGRKLSKGLRKGLYIVHGKKWVVK